MLATSQHYGQAIDARRCPRTAQRRLHKSPLSRLLCCCSHTWWWIPIVLIFSLLWPFPFDSNSLPITRGWKHDLPYPSVAHEWLVIVCFMSHSNSNSIWPLLVSVCVCIVFVFECSRSHSGRNILRDQGCRQSHKLGHPSGGWLPCNGASVLHATGSRQSHKMGHLLIWWLAHVCQCSAYLAACKCSVSCVICECCFEKVRKFQELPLCMPTSVPKR